MRFRNSFFLLYLIYIGAAGIYRLFLLKKGYTLYICMLVVVLNVSAQSQLTDSSQIKVPKIGLLYMSGELEIECCILDSMQFIDTMGKSKFLDSFNLLFAEVDINLVKSKNHSEISSLSEYEFLYAVDYLSESYYERSFPGHRYAILKILKSQAEWKEDFEKRYSGGISVWEYQDLLVINFDSWAIGHSYNNHSGITYYLRKK